MQERIHAYALAHTHLEIKENAWNGQIPTCNKNERGLDILVFLRKSLQDL